MLVPSYDTFLTSGICCYNIKVEATYQWKYLQYQVSVFCYDIGAEAKWLIGGMCLIKSELQSNSLTSQALLHTTLPQGCGMRPSSYSVYQNHMAATAQSGQYRIERVTHDQMATAVCEGTDTNIQ